MLEDLDDEGENKNGWLIKTRTKSFVVYAATSAEKREWMIHIQRCIEALLNSMIIVTLQRIVQILIGRTVKTRKEIDCGSVSNRIKAMNKFDRAFTLKLQIRKQICRFFANFESIISIL